MRVATVGISAWLVAVAIGLILYGGSLRNAYDLENHGAKTVAVVLTTSPPNHDYCKYRYTVSGKAYVESSDGCPVSIQPGSKFNIAYLPSKPAYSAVPGSTPPLGGGIFFIVLIATVVGGVAAGITYRLGNARRQAAPAT